MHFELDNQTPCALQAQSVSDAQGLDAALVLAKASFKLGDDSLLPIEQQTALRSQAVRKRILDLGLEEIQMRVLADWLEEEIVWQDHECSPPKARFEIVLSGHICSAQAQAAIDATVTLNDERRMLRAHAPRYFDGNQVRLVGPGVRSVPLCHLFAHWDGGIFAQPARLPAVVGRDAPEWLPWLDDPSQTLSRLEQKFPPRCFSLWPENAPTRLPYAGSFDAHWQANRAPRLPQDFSPRFFNIADASLQWQQAPSAGSLITLHNLGSQLQSALRWPRLRLMTRVIGADGRAQQTELQADTLEIDLQARQYSIVWRAMLAASVRKDARGLVSLWHL